MVKTLKKEELGTEQKNFKNFKQKLKKIFSYPRESPSPTYILFKKTFFIDICTIPKLIGSIFFMLLVPLFAISFFNPSYFISESYSLVSWLGIIVLMYSFCIVYALIMIFSAAPLISDEIKTGTMVTLVSRPISRFKIILGKYFALLVYGLIVSVIFLSSVCIIARLKYQFTEIFEFFIIHFLYSLMVHIIFGSLTMAFSSAFKKPRNAALIPAILVIITFFVLMTFRPLLMMSFRYPDEVPIYEKYQLYHFDLGYHLMNVYTYFVELVLTEVPEDMVYFFYMWGVYTEGEYSAQNPYEFSFTRTNYYLPLGSLLFLIVLSVILLTIGTYYFKKRDISL